LKNINQFISIKTISMTRIIKLLPAFLLASFSYAQTETSEIRMEKSKFYEGNRILKPREVLSRMEINPEAFQEFKKAKSNYDAAQVLGFAGGFLIGWPLGTALGGGDPQWGLAGGGAALLLASIPLNSGFKKHAKNALTIYNGRPLSRFQTSVRFRFYGYGAGFVLRM
jgi:hypothetical protein